MIIEDRSRNIEAIPSNEWEARNSKKGILKPRFMSAADYVFYLRRHLVAERRKNDPTVGHPGDESLSVGIPRLSFILRRLEEDIQSSYLSFLEEFVSDLHDGVGCLLNILRTCQCRQKGVGLFTYATCSRAKQSLINRGTIDEFYCLLCLKSLSKSSLAIEKISEHKTGLSTIASCIMSSHIKSRIVAIELLTAVSRAPDSGSAHVLEAMTAVRILFGESVRFKCLVSVLNSNINSTSGLETVTLVFLNTLLDQCPKLADRVRVQSELEEAGLDIDDLEKQLRDKFGNSTHRVWNEIDKWRELQVHLQDALQKHHENIKLRKEIELLKDALKRLKDERRGILCLHKQLKGQWTNMESRLQALALKSRVMTSSTSASSSSSSSEDERDHAPTPRRSHQPDSHDSELEEILIDIPTITAGSLLDASNQQPAGMRSADTPPPLPPNHPKLSDSGISSNSLFDSEPDLNVIDWHYPDVMASGDRRNGSSSVRVRFSESSTTRSSRRVVELSDGAVILPPGQNKTKCVDIVGVQNTSLPPNLQKVKKRFSTLGPKSKSKDKEKKVMPPKPNVQSRNIPVHSLPSNKLWKKSPPSRAPSQMGSSLDGMIHREIAKAIRDRHALFTP